MRAVLDTNVVIDFWTDVDLPPVQYAVSTVTIAELQYGVLAAADDATRARRQRLLARVLQHFEPLPVDEAVAASYAHVAAAVHRSGRQPRASGLLIAATAHAHDADLLTRQASDYDLGDLVTVRSP